MSSSPLTFQNLPPELKCRIMNGLDVRSLLRLSLTSKSIYEVIYASQVLVLCIEMAKSNLHPIMNIGSTSMARRFLDAHVDARLNLPIATRPCVIVPAPEGRIKERLFRGYLACITDNELLHVWNIQDPDPTRVPRQIMVISQPDLIDVFIQPDCNLLVLLCYDSDDHIITIKLLDLASRGKQPHPWATSPFITHIPLPDDNLDHDDLQLLTLSGELLAVVYPVDSRLDGHRGLVWTWRTGESIYDSMDFSSSSDFHDILLLPQANYFLVSVSTFLVDNPGTSMGAWIELRGRDSTTTPATSRLIAEFALPEFKDTAEHSLSALQFHSSEPLPCWQRYQEDKFPFTSDRVTSVHALHISYTTRPGVDIEITRRVYLIISNEVFMGILERLSEQGTPIASLPLRIAWNGWGLWGTSMWDYHKPHRRSSSICGSRICSVTYSEGQIELVVVDFDMKTPCSRWGCTDPLAHSYPITFGPSDSFWARTVRTWLPFHTFSKRFILRGEGDRQLLCNPVLIDEERVVFPTMSYPDEEVFEKIDPANWKIVHLLREPTPLDSSSFLPVPVLDDEPMESCQWQHDQICRLCKEKPHTDAHILVECSANPSVVALRRGYFERVELRDVPPVDGLFEELMARRGCARIHLSILVTLIAGIYNDLPECSELVLADQENTASRLFATKREIECQSGCVHI